MSTKKNSSYRRTVYKSPPFQTQSMGTQKLVFDIGPCFAQSCRLETASALELLISGDSSRGVSTGTLVRQFGLTTDKVKTIPQIGKALPSMPSIENDSLEQVGRELADLADDNGAWRENFERHAPSLVDQKVVEIESGLEQLVETTVNMKGFLIAENLLSNLEESYKELALESTSKWQPAHSERLRHSSQTYIYLDEEVNQTRTMFKPWAKGLKKDDKLQIRQQFERDIRIGEVRIQQCKAELVTRILARFLDNQNKRSLAEHSKIVAKQVEQLRALKESVNSSIEPLKDTVTVTQLIESTTDILTDDRSLHDLITGAFKANRCDRHDVARAFRKGIRYKGARISPSDLADMEINQAKRLLFKFADTFFNGAAETVLRIDFTEESVQLLFAKKLRTVYEKANPYFRFMDLAGVQRIRETYIHCHPEVRLLVDKYRSGTPRYSNPATDKPFHLPERHVLVVTSNVLGPGHARRIYACARYIRDRMIGEGTFAPLHPFDQLMARPLAIEKRPDDRHDSEQLFNLALESGNINERTAADGLALYSMAEMDETIRFCFQTKVVSRIYRDGDYFCYLSEEGWFKEFIESVVGGLPDDWLEKLTKMLNSASAEQVAAEMVSLGILEKKSSEPLYRVTVQHRSNRPFRKELYQMTTGTRAGLSRESFISKLFSTDELYTRVLEDVISGEAKGQIRYRRLTPFAKEQVDERRRGTQF